jgi:hypothetical protein
MRLVTGQWFSPVPSTNKTDCHDITEILLKVVLNTIKQTNQTILREKKFKLYGIVLNVCLIFCYNAKYDCQR